MDSSVGQTIERIKMQEQDNEVKLREKRECEFGLIFLFLNRFVLN